MKSGFQRQRRFPINSCPTRVFFTCQGWTSGGPPRHDLEREKAGAAALKPGSVNATRVNLVSFGRESALPRHGFEGQKSPKRGAWLPRVSRLLLDLAGPPACLGAVGDFRARLFSLSCFLPLPFSFLDLVGMGEKEVSQVSRRGSGP